MRLPVDWVDAFSDRPFGGNGCAVVHDGGTLDAETCLRFTRETSLVECTFVGPSDVADARVRYFLAMAEIPFAGHPTIATVASLAHRGWIGAGGCTLETGAGVLTITLRDGWIEMTQPAPRFGAQVPEAEVAALVGLAPEDIAVPPQVVSTGLPFCITVLRDPQALQRAVLDPARLEAFRARHAMDGVPFIEPYLVVRTGFTEAGDTSARLLLPPPNPPEDPFTGSATGATAAYLWARGLIGRPEYVAEQGHLMGRPGQARVHVLGPATAIEGVRVAGRAHVLMSGDLIL